MDIIETKNNWISWSDFLGTAGQGAMWTKNTLIEFLKQYRDTILTAESAELLIILEEMGLEHRLNTNEKFKAIILNDSNSDERRNAYSELMEDMGEKTPEGNEELNDVFFPEEELDEPEETDVTDEIDIDGEKSINLPPQVLMEGFKLLDHEYVHADNMSEDKINFIIENRINKMWNLFLSDKLSIKDIKKDKDNRYYITKIKTTFLEEYELVSKIKNPSGYCFEHQPSMMQKLIAHRLHTRKTYGNFSSVGSGKTLGGVFAGRYVGAKNVIIVTYNSTLRGWEKSLKSYFNDCTVYMKKLKGVKFEEGKNNYLLLNYEFFQQGERAENRLYEFMENNKIDYVILDEVHSVKQRKEDNSLTTDEMVEQGFLSNRRRLMMRFINDVQEKNKDVYFMTMTATPIINNLIEAKKLLEMMHGEKYDDLPTDNRRVKSGLEFHKHIVLNGIRYIHEPKNKNGDKLKEPKRHEISIDGSDLIDRLENVTNDLHIEQILLDHKLDNIRPYLRKGSLIFTYYVEGIVDPIREYCENLGFKVGLYTGRQNTLEREEVKEKFQEGKLDIIIGSLPIGTGVDGFQDVADRIILMSLPWTHSEYDQLIGRIHREGSPHLQIDVVIPKVVIDYELNGEQKSWSRDRHKLNVIKFKKDLFGVVVDGVLPDNIVTNFDSIRSKTIKSLNELISKIHSGEAIVNQSRDEIEKEYLTHKELDTYRRKVSELGEYNRKWNTQRSETTFSEIQNNPKEWHEYHKRYREVRKLWSEEEIPYKVIGKKIKSLSKEHLIVCDFGCGDNLLSKEISNEVKAFDMFAADDTVTVADVTNLPLPDESTHIGVFSLSLMGRNYLSALKEANRVIVTGGRLFVAEPLNRWENRESGYEELGVEIESCGFDVTKIICEGSFVYVDAIKPI